MHALLQKLDKRPTYPVGLVNGKIAVASGKYSPEDFESSDEDDVIDNTPYEQEFVQEELKRYAAGPSSQVSGFADEVSTIGDMSQCTIVPEGRTEPSEVYRKHNFKLKADIKGDLPIDSFQAQILSRIECNQVTVIEGPTGCGKTTQVPQMIMDSLREKNQYCNIVVTQPRKIATINVAKRVCVERGWTLGTVCGYQVGLEKKVAPDQLITFMTIGVLLQKLIRAKTLREYTHIIIDEVHERNQELDFLLLIVRKFLFMNSPYVKVILMSATINAEEFAWYFRKQTESLSIVAPIIKVDKVSQFTKTIFYLNQISSIQRNMPRFDIYKPEICKDIWNVFTFLVRVFDKVPLSMDGNDTVNYGSVLVFLPGINEIEEAHNLLIEEEKKAQREAQEAARQGKPFNVIKWDIIPLHSSLPNDEQAQVFKPAVPGQRKIILSTNIAESSVTVPDSCYVIDFCLTKVMTVDPVTKYMSLKLEWASHVNCDQRAGRVGRTCDGRVYRLVSKEFYLEEMERTPTPEMVRAPLERVVLQAKMLELQESPARILALAMKPPNLKNIESTIWQLKEIGGLLKTCRGLISNSDGDITFLGQVMASLPVDVHLSKMIVLGQLFSCLEETVIIAAGCSIQNIFSIPFQKRLEAYKKVLLWADGSCSDLIALLNLYQVYQFRKCEHAFTSLRMELEWCQRNLVSLKGLKEWQLLVTEIKQRLDRMQIKETVGPGKVHLSNTEKPTVLKIVMAGAFYPNYFIKSAEVNQIEEREAVKIVGGRDPFSTVYFSGLDPQQPGQIYVRQIKRLIHDRDENETDVHIGFDGSTKIYVQFRSSGDPVVLNIDGFNRLTTVPAKIPSKVYEMIRKRQLKYNFELRLLDLDKAWKFAEEHGSRNNRDLPVEVVSRAARSVSPTNCFSSVNYNPIPSPTTQYITIQISNHIDAGHFWAQNCDENTNELLHTIEKALNDRPLKPIDEQPKVGKLYATQFREDNLFYRCKVTATAGRVSQVLFIDYGNYQEVCPEELYELPQQPHCLTAGLAFECVMYGVKPSNRQQTLGTWSEQVNESFRRWTQGIMLFCEIYSVVNEIVEVEVYRSNEKTNSLNKYMIENGYAESCSPSYISKRDHEQRIALQNIDIAENSLAPNVDQIVSYTDFADPKEFYERSTVVKLKGPFSPLEARLFACTGMGGTKPVDIEGVSVNAVLLDTEPESLHSRLLVAAYVGQTAGGGRLKLRQTTLLPNVPGLPMMLAALFCPTMEPKVTDDNTLVSAILCGLGYNEQTMKPLFPMHDMIIKLDTELKMEEVEMINKLRYALNNGLKQMDEMEQHKSTQNQLLSTQINVKEHLFRLLNMEREPIIRQNIHTSHFKWGVNGGLGILRPNISNEENDIWPLLGFVRMAKLNQFQRDITKNLEDIENMVYAVKPFEEITCLLCDEICFTVNELRYHIISRTHKEKLEEFKKVLETEDDDEEPEV